MGEVHHRPRRERGLLAAAGALVAPVGERIPLLSAATRADKTLEEPLAIEMCTAICLVSVACQKLA